MSSTRGRFKLAWRSDILCLSLIGNCDLAMILRVHQAARQAWQERAGQPWGAFTDLRLFEGISPEALQAIWAILEEAIDHGMAAAGDVRAPGHFRVTPSAIQERVTSRTRFRICTSVDEAMAWFAEQGLRSD
jgi:hypothetical protein